jgi:esterase/lipase superfamily enzyme
LLLLGVAVCACSGRGPAAAPGPTGSSPARPGYATKRVYFVTDRRFAGDRDGVAEFEGQPRSAELRYGFADVAIPDSHRVGKLESPLAFGPLHRRPDPMAHIAVLRAAVLSRDEFYRQLRGAGPSAHTMLFIHGYNVSFDRALRRAAQLATDLHLAGPAIVYSWPSAGAPHGYGADAVSLRETVPDLARFIDDLAGRLAPGSLNVVAHSMGAAALSYALGSTRLPHRLSIVVLAAPDIACASFLNLADRIRRSAARVTIYVSARDRMLKISALFNGRRRLGDAEPAPIALPGFDTVDVTHADDADYLGHGYFASALLRDIYLGLRRSANRALSRRELGLLPIERQSAHCE